MDKLNAVMGFYIQEHSCYVFQPLFLIVAEIIFIQEHLIHPAPGQNC